MRKTVILGNKTVGDSYPTYITAEIGINHNGEIDNALKLIDAAVHAGCDAVKFQKRTPEICVPPEQHSIERDTPWGRMTYIEYRHKIEFGYDEFKIIDEYCSEKEIDWFASCWDIPSVDFIEQFNPICYKIASATLTDADLLRYTRSKGRPVILSTGMSTMEEIEAAVSILGEGDLIINHCTSTYPAHPEELNLNMIRTLREHFDCPIGYSGHEVGLPPSVIAVALGARFIERHITLDRAMWGSDQAASVEPGGIEKLVKYIRSIELSMGDGKKCVYESEIPIKKKLRRTETLFK